MRSECDKSKILGFMKALAPRVGEGRIYLTGGATALLYEWRTTTIDVNIKPDPEPAGLYEALAIIKDELDINIELASPDQFIPPLHGWRERSPFIARHARVDFHHYDLYSQALAKIERGHPRDLNDVRAMIQRRLITVPALTEHFHSIVPSLLRYPAIDPPTFQASLLEFCASLPPPPP